MHRAIILAAAMLLLPTAARSQAHWWFPKDPVAGESLLVTINSCTATQLSAVEDDTTVRIRGRTASIFGCFREVVSTKPLPAGPRDLYLELPDKGSELLARLSVPAWSPVAPAFRTLSGNWHPPEEPGWGLNIVQGESGALFAVWLGHAQPGVGPSWLVMPGGRWLDAKTFRGEVYLTWGVGPDKPWVAPRTEPYGFFKLTFVDANEAKFEGDFFSFWGAGTHHQSKTLRRVRF